MKLKKCKSSGCDEWEDEKFHAGYCKKHHQFWLFYKTNGNPHTKAELLNQGEYESAEDAYNDCKKRFKLIFSKSNITPYIAGPFGFGQRFP